MFETAGSGVRQAATEEGRLSDHELARSDCGFARSASASLGDLDAQLGRTRPASGNIRRAA
jgi:hypothetical protein